MNSQNENHKVWLYNLAWYEGRKIGKVCLDWGVILHGLEINRWSKNEYTLRRFREEMQENDIVVMRYEEGGEKFHAVGQIVGSHEWHDEFRNIDGWDLSLVRRVRWLWDGTDSDQPIKLSFVGEIKKTNIILQSINNSIASQINEELKRKDLYDKSKSPLRQLPVPTEKITHYPEDAYKEYLKDVYKKDVSKFLEENPICLPDKSLEVSLNSKLKDQLGKMAELLKWHELNWYRNPDAYPSEHETVCHFVVPLLMTLGWTPKQIAVEWEIPGMDKRKKKRIDIALFQNQDGNPCQRKSLLAIVEVKQLGKALLPAYSQAKEYWEEIDNPPKCKRIIATDGRRYIVYKNTKGEFEICAYMDLARPRDKYPVCYYYHKCEEGPQEACEKGFKDALLAMRPNGCP